MARYACWCLNVTIHLLDEPVDLEWDWAIFKMPGVGMLGIGGVTTMYKELVQEQHLEPQPGKEWDVYTCINCSTVVYAQRKHSTRQVVLEMALMRAPENVDDLDGYSPTFQIVVKTEKEEVGVTQPLVAATLEQEVLLKRIGELGEKALGRANEDSEERIRNFVLDEKEAIRRFRRRVGEEQRAVWQTLRVFQSTQLASSEMSPGSAEASSPTALNPLAIGELMSTLNPVRLDTTDITHSAQSRGDVDPKRSPGCSPLVSPTSHDSPQSSPLHEPGKPKRSWEPEVFDFHEIDGNIAFEESDVPSVNDAGDEELERALSEIQKSKWAYRKAVEEGKAAPTDDGGLGKHKSPDEKLYSSSLPIAVGSRSVLHEKLDTEATTDKEEIPEPFIVPHELYSKTLAEQSPFSETFDRPTSVTREFFRDE